MTDIMLTACMHGDGCAMCHRDTHMDDVADIDCC